MFVFKANYFASKNRAWKSQNSDQVRQVTGQSLQPSVAALQHEVGNCESQASETVTKFGSGQPVDDGSHDGAQGAAQSSKRPGRKD